MTKLRQQKSNKNYGLGDLHAREVDLLLLIRTKYRFGEITLIVADGLPKQVLKTIERKLMADTYPQ